MICNLGTNKQAIEDAIEMLGAYIHYVASESVSFDVLIVSRIACRQKFVCGIVGSIFLLDEDVIHCMCDASFE